MKNTILVSLIIFSVSFFFIGQTEKQKDFDAQTKYKLLEGHLIKLINDKKTTDAKLEELESELKEVSAHNKVQSALIKQYESSRVSKYEKTNSVRLDWSSEQRLEKVERQVRDLKKDLGRHKNFFGFNYVGGGLGFGTLNTLEEIQTAIKANRVHFH